MKKHYKKYFDTMKLGIVGILLVIGLSLFYIGFHNIDLSYNFKGLGTTDCSSFGCISLTDIYINGLLQIQVGFYCVIIDVFLITLFWRLTNENSNSVVINKNKKI